MLILHDTSESAKLAGRFLPITMLIGNILSHYGVTARAEPLQ